MDAQTVKKIDTRTLSGIIDDAFEIKEQKEEILRQLNLGACKADAKKRILEATQAMGKPLSEEEADLAIEKYLEGLYTFKEPSASLSIKLANLYVNRAKLWHEKIFPTIATLAMVGAVGLVTLGVVKYTKYAALQKKERAVESKVETAYKTSLRLKSDLVSLNSSINQIPRSDSLEFMSLLNTSQYNLAGVDSFFLAFCPKGSASKTITAVNYTEVDKKLQAVAPILLTAEGSIVKGKTIIQTQQQIISTSAGLEAAIKEIRNAQAPKKLEDNAELLYQNGLASLEHRQLSDAQKYQQQLLEVKKDIQQLISLPPQLEQLFSSIKTIAKEKNALAKAESLHAQGESFVSSMDAASLDQTVGELKYMNDILKQSYTIKVVNRDGEKSGMDRYYTDRRGIRVSGYYLIVEALDSRGKALPLKITNEEDNKTYDVSKWGERVPGSVFERVKEDKEEDGLIQPKNSIYGMKETGYLTEQVKMLGNDGKLLTKLGEITKW